MPPLLTEVHPPPLGLERFAGIVRPSLLREGRVLAERLRKQVASRVVWNVSSTAAGGGVAEMLHRLVGFARGLGLDARWLVIRGDPGFFRVTKRLHHALHGEMGDGSPLDAKARTTYESVLGANARELCEHVGRGDIVLLHDPQTAALAPSLAALGAAIVWRCHIGADDRSPEEERGWEFLRPYLGEVHRCVFTCEQYVPGYLREKTVLIPPSIDPQSPKNQPMTTATVRAILTHVGIVSGQCGRGRRVFMRTDGTPARVENAVERTSVDGAPSWQTPLVVQVSRWDRLKDPLGVMRAFGRFVTDPAANDAELVLAGPQDAAVSDDPEGVEVLAEVHEAWTKLDLAVRRRVHLVSLPMADPEENAAMVNALQRHAAVVVQKSVREGFGLTVTEAMWKARPVIAAAVGGIQDQIESGVTGLLVDPHDDDAFRAALLWMFEDVERARRVGRRGRERVRQEYLGLTSLLRWGNLLGALIEA